MLMFLVAVAVAFFIYAMVKYYAAAEGATKWDKVVAALTAAAAGLWALVTGAFNGVFGG